MKFSPILLAPFLAWGAYGGAALAQSVAVAPAAPDPLKQSVALPATGTSLDDDLIALGRAAKINIIADASQWPTDAPALSGPRTGPPPTLLQANTERPLSWLAGDNALLVWTRPDILVLARRIAAGEDITRIAMPPVPATAVAAVAPVAKPDAKFGAGVSRFNGVDIQSLMQTARLAQQNEPSYWNARWNEYLSALPDGKTRAPGWTRDIALSDLPPDLHAFVLASAQDDLLPDDLMAHWRSWVTEDFWKTARLSIRDMDTTVAGQKMTDPPQKKKVSMLFIGNTLQVTPGQRGNTSMSIAVLGDAPATATPIVATR